MSLNLQTVELIKATYPKLQQHGTKVTKRMYDILFTEYPECQNLFAETNEQPQKLAKAILSFVSHIDEIEALASTLERIAKRHVDSNVKAIHYPMVADALISAMDQVIGPPVFSEEVSNAWVEAFMFLASHLISIESDLYAFSYKQNNFCKQV